MPLLIAILSPLDTPRVERHLLDSFPGHDTLRKICGAGAINYSRFVSFPQCRAERGLRAESGGRFAVTPGM